MRTLHNTLKWSLLAMAITWLGFSIVLLTLTAGLLLGLVKMRKEVQWL